MNVAREKTVGYIPTLDGWRAVAILLVIAQHAAPELAAPASFLRRVLRHGGLGVDIFFGISGYLITTRLLRQDKENWHVRITTFYRARIFRILPASWLYLATISVLVWLGVLSVPWRFIVSALALYRNYLPIGTSYGDRSWYVSHFWSLNVEEHFYLLWPLLLVLADRRRLLVIAPLLATLSALWRGACLRYPGINPFPDTVIMYRTDAALDGLLWGCWLALVCDHPTARARLTRWLRPPIWTFLTIATVLLVAWSPPFHRMLLAFVIPFILLGTVLHPGAPAGRLLEFPPIRWIGRISYSLYLWQQLFFTGHGSRSPLLGSLQHWPWNLAAAFAVATASYYLIERPFHKLGHRRRLTANAIAAQPGHPGDLDQSRPQSGPDGHEV
jgi:peptidoglycan/LPS O-acetylase OafA/YrhL